MTVTVILSGIISSDIRVSSGEKNDVVSFDMADTRSYLDAKSGERKEVTQFASCVRFMAKGKGQNLADKLWKGRKMTLDCTLQTGEKRPGTTRAGEKKEFRNLNFRIEDILDWGPKKQTA
jgi:single-stranded DNA-binding protein